MIESDQKARRVIINHNSSCSMHLVDENGNCHSQFNWYTRRIVLAGIYKATELYMLQDNSTDHHETWKFLERRIEDAAQLHRVLSVAPGPPDLNQATEAASAAFVTVSDA